MLLKHDREIHKSNFSDVKVGLKSSVALWTMDYHIDPLLGTTAYVPPKLDGSFQTCNVMCPCLELILSMKLTSERESGKVQHHLERRNSKK
jgi:hypothetical protein